MREAAGVEEERNGEGSAEEALQMAMPDAPRSGQRGTKMHWGSLGPPKAHTEGAGVEPPGPDRGGNAREGLPLLGGHGRRSQVPPVPQTNQSGCPCLGCKGKNRRPQPGSLNFSPTPEPRAGAGGCNAEESTSLPPPSSPVLVLPTALGPFPACRQGLLKTLTGRQHHDSRRQALSSG